MTKERIANFRLGELGTKPLISTLEQVSYNEKFQFKLDIRMLSNFCDAMNVPKRFKLYLEMIRMSASVSSENTSLRIMIDGNGETRSKLKKTCGIINNQEFNNCIRQLRDNNLIIEVGTNTYWINPAYIFIGKTEDQVKVIKDFVTNLKESLK